MMYSGSDSNESQKYPQWSLNPTTYQGMANEQVDWAALAQQWIIMKEAGPPPLPADSRSVPKQKTDGVGEAPMDVESEKDDSNTLAPVWNVNEPPPPPGAEPWAWNAQNHSWNWSNSWIPPSVVPPPPNIGPMKAPLLPTPSNAYNAPPDSGNDNAVSLGGYNSAANNEFANSNAGYWTSSAAANNSTVGNSSAVPSKHIKPHNKRYSKVNVPVRVSAPLPPAAVLVENVSSVPPMHLDTARRKQLPAWIREGLEKMEKDKLKIMEREKQRKDNVENFEKNKERDEETMEILKNTMKERQKSRFESDGENSEEEVVKPKRKKLPSPEPVPLTPDELMLKVRRMMTEILLNVTNRQIEIVCKEEHQRYTKKYRASDHRSAAPGGGANLSAKLGLGIYGQDSDSSSEEDDDVFRRSTRDSDDELRDIIKKRMSNFQKTEREIEERLDEAERRKAGSTSRSTSPESVDNDSQVDARAQDDKSQQGDNDSPYNSKAREKSKNRSPSTASDDDSNFTKNSRRSSSSSSHDSYKKIKSKHRDSRSNSRSAETRPKTSARWSRSRTPVKRESSSSRRNSNSSRKKASRRSRSRSRSYSSRSRRSRSSSYRRSKRSYSREKSSRKVRSRSTSRSRYSSSKSDRRRRRRSRSDSSGRGKRSHRH